MSLLEHEPHVAETKAGKADAHKQTIIALGTLAVLLLTYLMYRRHVSNQTPATGTASPASFTPSGSGGSAGADTGAADTSSVLNAVGSQLQSATDTVAQLQGEVTGLEAHERAHQAMLMNLSNQLKSSWQHIHQLEAHHASNVHQTPPRRTPVQPHVAPHPVPHQTPNPHPRPGNQHRLPETHR